MVQRDNELSAQVVDCLGTKGVDGVATVRARYERGVLTPLEPLNLEEGKEVMVSVDAEIATDGAEKSKMPSDSLVA